MPGLGNFAGTAAVAATLGKLVVHRAKGTDSHYIYVAPNTAKYPTEIPKGMMGAGHPARHAMTVPAEAASAKPPALKRDVTWDASRGRYLT
jgi:hypothetical protein